jgi:hypothetical protein
MLDLQNIVRAALNRVGDGLSMGWAHDKRLEDEHVQGSLDHFGLQRRFASRHVVLSMID